MENAELIELLCSDLQSQYQCHTAILYGSRSRDDWDAASDVDVVAFRDAPNAERIAERWRGHFLDLFIYSVVEPIDPSWVRLVGGQVLFQADGFGDKILAQVNEIYDAGPELISALEHQFRRTWAEKMLQRAAKGDAEGDYRRHWLLFTLLEDYFAVRGRWYLGPKKSLFTLRATCDSHYHVFEAAFRPTAALADIKALIETTYSDA